MANGFALDDAMQEKIRARLRTYFSPRHVPDRIYAVMAIPFTLTGKKMEIPVRKILLGVPADKVVNRGAMAEPWALDYFLDFAAQRSDYSLT